MHARRRVEGASGGQRGQPGQGAGTAAFSWSPRSCPQASVAPCAFWFVLFCFFLSEAKEACAAISREGQWIFFFGGGLLLCGRLSRAGASLVAVCGLLVVGAALVEHGLWGVWASVAADHRLSSCSCQALAQ